MRVPKEGTKEDTETENNICRQNSQNDQLYYNSNEEFKHAKSKKTVKIVYPIIQATENEKLVFVSNCWFAN